MCISCGSLLSPLAERGSANKLVNMYYRESQKPWVCLLCGKSQNVKVCISVNCVYAYFCGIDTFECNLDWWNPVLRTKINKKNTLGYLDVHVPSVTYMHTAPNPLATLTSILLG